MSTMTIPKKITKGDELVVLSRQEYEKLLTVRKIIEFNPTNREKKDLARARKNRKEGKVLTLHELKQNLGITS